MKSSVHPKYKTKYRVGNWSAYGRALVQRGDVTLWLTPGAISTWEAVGVGKRGGQLQYSDLAIETALTLRLIFDLPLRQTEGFLTSIFRMLDVELSAPDHNDALATWPASRANGGHGKRGWKKLHFGVDRSGVILAQALTDTTVADATMAVDLIEAVDGDLASVTADAAYDPIAFYDVATARGAQVVVPPAKTASVSRRKPRSSARGRTIKNVKKIGRRRWKKASGYHRQARVENACRSAAFTHQRRGHPTRPVRPLRAGGICRCPDRET